MAQWIQGKTGITPQLAGYDISRLNLLSDYYGSLVDAGRIQAGGYLLARRGEIFAHQAAGRLTHRDDSPEIRVDAIKRAASVTKIFTAAAVMKLVENGTIWLDQPVKDIIPEFNTPLHGGITIWHLLTHTSGLPADPGYFCEPYPIPWFRMTECDEWIKVVLSGPIQAKPGTQWNYCTLGFCILGEIITRISGKHYADYLQDEIFKPLGMTRTFVDIPDSLINEVCINADWELEDISQIKARTAKSSLGGYGVFTTLNDLFRFGQCFLNGGTLDGVRILGRTTAETMTRNQLDSVPSYHWGKNCINYRQGLGWGFYCDGTTVAPSCYNHEGWGWCSLFVDPKEEFIYASFSADHSDWHPDVMVKPRTIAWSGIL